MTTKISSRGLQVPQLIRDREAFETFGALSAGYDAGYPLGQLPYTYREQLIEHTTDAQGRAVNAYIVRSYETPIAWWTEAHGWVTPRVKYSRTTTRHQGRLYLIPRGQV